MSQLHVRRWENVIIIRLVPMEEDKITYFFNKKWVLKKRPQGLFNAKTCALEEASVCAGDLKENEILVKTEYLSVDAFIRTMLDETKNAVHKGIDVGGTVPAIGIGQVVSLARLLRNHLSMVENEGRERETRTTITSFREKVAALGALRGALKGA